MRHNQRLPHPVWRTDPIGDPTARKSGMPCAAELLNSISPIDTAAKMPAAIHTSLNVREFICRAMLWMV